MCLASASFTNAELLPLCPDSSLCPHSYFNSIKEYSWILFGRVKLKLLYLCWTQMSILGHHPTLCGAGMRERWVQEKIKVPRTEGFNLGACMGRMKTHYLEHCLGAGQYKEGKKTQM